MRQSNREGRGSIYSSETNLQKPIGPNHLARKNIIELIPFQERLRGSKVATAVAFGIGLGLKDGPGKASEFYAGYLLEQSLSVDNLFVFVLIFKYFKVPIEYQNRVLTYGISGAIVFRLTIILLGTATLQRFEAVNLLLAAILLYSSFQ